jgi:hypothetical protein
MMVGEMACSMEMRRRSIGDAIGKAALWGPETPVFLGFSARGESNGADGPASFPNRLQTTK